MDLDQGWDIKTPEQWQPQRWLQVDGKPVVWEACQTFSGSWGYHRDESSWKSVDQLVRMLCDTVSKGGNLLLNVGPTGRGELDTTRRKLAQAQWRMPSLATCPQPALAATAIGDGGSHASASVTDCGTRRLPTSITNGPSSNAAVSPRINRLAPSSGENTTAIINSDGTFKTAEPCTSVSAPSMPRPRRQRPLDTGTMQAEQRFMTGPRPKPLRMRPTQPRAGAPPPSLAGTRNASAIPPATKANNMPSATSCRYVSEKRHQRWRKPLAPPRSASPSTQKP